MNSRLSRHLKRVIAAAIVMTLVAGAAPVQNFAPLADVSITASAETLSGNLINNSNVSWKFDTETGVVTFSGTGKIVIDHSSYIYNHRSSIVSVDIDEGITGIGYGVFENCTNLTSITIPNSVTEIGDLAFDGCTSLTSITIPENVTTIGYTVFKGCTGLTSITIPEKVTEIGYGAFSGCTGLTELTVPSSMKDIEMYAFSGCTNLKSVIFEGDSFNPDDSWNTSLYVGWNAFDSLTDDVSVEIPRGTRTGQATVYSHYLYPYFEKYEHGYEYTYEDYDFGSAFGNAKVTIKDNGVTYTKVEKVEATCTTDGNSEYYKGSDGKFYWDSLGYYKFYDESEAVIKAYGHSEKVAWSWTKLSSGDYTAVAKFSCYEGDLDTKYVTAIVTSTGSDEGTTYHAVAICPLDDDMYYRHESGHEVTYDYFVESTKYTVTVEGGSITSAAQNNEYKYNDSVTVKADKKKDGKCFTGWYIGDKCVSTNPSYTFFVKENTTITAKYEEQEKDQTAVVSLTLTRGENTYKQQIKYSYSWSLPEGSTLVEAGVLRAYDKDISDVTPDTAKANGVTQNKSSLKTVNGTYNLTVNMSYDTKQKTVYAKGYIIYTDAQGVKHTQMTDMQTSAYEN